MELIDIINYVKSSPENTNPAVLSTLVESYAGEHGGGGGGITKIHDEDIAVNCSDSTAVTVKDFEIEGLPTEDDFNKLVYVKVRDKAGWRPGYFYGSDNFASPIGIFGGGTNAVSGIRYTCSETSGDINCSGATQSTFYGVYVGQLSTLGGFRLMARYNSTSSRLINGTFNVQVYVIPLTLFDPKPE